MSHNSTNDSRWPLDPGKPEDFLVLGEQGFLEWWNELDPPRCCDGIQLDIVPARKVWMAAYEHQWDALQLVYGSARVHNNCATAAEIELGYVVDRYHRGLISIPVNDFVGWVAEHEEGIRRSNEGDNVFSIRVYPSAAAPPLAGPKYQPPRFWNSLTERRSRAEDQFQDWWSRLEPAGTYDGIGIASEQAGIVWRAAFMHLWDALELVHDRATAHWRVAETTAELELGYIVDRYHNGLLSIDYDDLIDFSVEHEEHIRRGRDHAKITIRLVHRA